MVYMRRWHGRHLKRLPQTRAFTGLDGIGAIEALTIAFAICLGGDHPNVDRHVISQILIPGDESDAILILKANTAGLLVVDPIEVLNGCHDGVGSVMWIDLHSHGYPCSNLGLFIKKQLKGDVFRYGCRLDLLCRSGDIGSRFLRPSVLSSLHR